MNTKKKQTGCDLQSYRECSEYESEHGEGWDGKKWTSCGWRFYAHSARALAKKFTKENGNPYRVVRITEEVIFQTENVSKK